MNFARCTSHRVHTFFSTAATTTSLVIQSCAKVACTLAFYVHFFLSCCFRLSVCRSACYVFSPITSAFPLIFSQCAFAQQFFFFYFVNCKTRKGLAHFLNYDVMQFSSPFFLCTESGRFWLFYCTNKCIFHP